MRESFWRLIVPLVMAFCIVIAILAACNPVTPTPVSPLPSPTPESPLGTPTPPVSPLQVPQATDFVYSAWWDQWVRCTHMGITPTLKVAVKWLELDTGALAFSETLDTGEAAPSITGTEQFDGDFMPNYPTNGPTEDAGEWARAWWSIPGGGPWHCFDEWGSLVEVDEVEAEWFQGGSQDAEGYWFIREVAGVTPEYHIYCPLSLHGDVPTEAGAGGGDVWRTVGWMLAGAVWLVLVSVLVWQIYLYLKRRSKGKV